MPLLQVKDFPADIYEAILSAANTENRTIAQETIVLIKRGLEKDESNKARRKVILDRIIARDVPEAAKAVDDAKLIREDRER